MNTIIYVLINWIKYKHMSFQIHQFDTRTAKEHGVDVAILRNAVILWKYLSTLNKDPISKPTLENLCAQFPFWSEYYVCQLLSYAKDRKLI